MEEKKIEYKMNFYTTSDLKRTICLLTLKYNDKQKETFGISRLHPKDEYNESKGNKLALERALAKIEFKNDPKKYRKQIWEGYFASIAQRTA